MPPPALTSFGGLVRGCSDGGINGKDEGLNCHHTITDKIKLCSRGAQTCALPLFCDRDLEINPMTLKLESDLDVLKMYPQTENEAARLRHVSRSKVKMSKAPNYFERYRNRYSYQAQVISDHYTLSLFRCRDLDLRPMNLKLNRNLDTLKTYLQTENEVAR